MNIFSINNLLSLSLYLFSASILIFISAVIYKNSYCYHSTRDINKIKITKKRLHLIGRFCVALFSLSLTLFAIGYYVYGYYMFDLFSPFLFLIGLFIFFWNLSYKSKIVLDKFDLDRANFKEANKIQHITSFKMDYFTIEQKDGTNEKAKIVRSMIEHENMLFNNRITWTLTTQGFLIASTGLFWDKSKLIVTLISLLGILLSASFRHTLGGSNKAIDSLYEKYKGYDPPVIGDRRDGVKNILLVWNLLPFSLIGFWIAIIISLYL